MSNSAIKKSIGEFIANLFRDHHRLPGDLVLDEVYTQMALQSLMLERGHMSAAASRIGMIRTRVCGHIQKKELREQVFAIRNSFGRIRDTPTPPTHLTCIFCRETKPITEFNRKLSKKIGYQPRCKPCNVEVVRLYRQAKKRVKK